MDLPRLLGIGLASVVLAAALAAALALLAPREPAMPVHDGGV